MFHGEEVGVVVKECPDRHPFVYLLNEKLTTRTCCVDPERGDTIVKISKNDD